MNIQVHGQLKHHFWGSYFATIVLTLDNPFNDLAAVQEVLGPRWVMETHKTGGYYLIWHGADVDAQVAMLAKYGADPKKITSLAKSVDYGEPFTATIPVKDRKQMDLVM